MSEDKTRTAYLDVLARIESFEELEILLALFRDHEHARVGELAVRAMMPEAHVIEALARLERSALIVRGADDAYAIRRDDSHLEAAIQEVHAEYESNRLGVMAQMNANAIDRVRTSALRAFARAFILRSKNDG